MMRPERARRVPGVGVVLALLASLAVPAGSLAASTGGLTPLGATAEAAVLKLGLPSPSAGPVTRADAMEAVDAVVGLSPDTTASPNYADVPAASSAFGAIEAAVQAGLMAGWAPTSGDFDPTGTMSRIDLAVLATNALGLEAKAQSLQGDASTYPSLVDLSRAGDSVGEVVLMLKDGIVPPEDATRFEPFHAVTVETLDVTLYRMWLAVDVPVGLAVTAETQSPAVNEPDPLGAMVTNRLGGEVPLASLARDSIAFSLQGVSGAAAALSGSGAFGPAAFGGVTEGTTFTAAVAGNFVLSASVTGTFVRTPVTASTTLTVAAPAPVVRPPTYTLTTAASGDYAAGNTTGVTFTLSENGTPVPAGLSVTLTAAGAASDSGAFGLSSTDGGTPETSIAVPTNGNGEVTVFLTDTTAGDSGTVAASAYGVTAATGTITITAETATASASATLVAPAAATGTITLGSSLETGYASVVVDFTGTVPADAGLIVEPGESAYCEAKVAEPASTFAALVAAGCGNSPSLPAVVSQSGDVYEVTLFALEPGSSYDAWSAVVQGAEGSMYLNGDPSLTDAHFSGGESAADTVTVNGTTFTAVPSSPTTGQYDDASSLATAIAGTAGTDARATASGNAVTLTASAPGTGGNTITLSASDPSDTTLSGATLTGGSNGALTLTFSQPMDPSVVTTANLSTVLIPSTGTFGAGATADWISDTELEIDLGSGAAVASGDTITVASSVTDTAGNPVAGPIPVP